MTTIVAVEDVLIAECKDALGKRVRGVDSLPGDWDDDLLKRLLRAVPGAFVAFGGGQAASDSGIDAALDARWSVIVCTGHASGEAARRRGDTRQVGCYELIATLVPRLHGFVVPDVGTLKLLSVENLYSGVVDSQGLAVYVMTFALPLAFTYESDLDLLAPFETFDARYDVPPLTPQLHPAWLAGDESAGGPDARDLVALPQPTD